LVIIFKIDYDLNKILTIVNYLKKKYIILLYVIIPGEFGANGRSEKTYLFYFGANGLYPKRISFFCRKWAMLVIFYMNKITFIYYCKI
jgi:hypothetical protein